MLRNLNIIAKLDVIHSKSEQTKNKINTVKKFFGNLPVGHTFCFEISHNLRFIFNIVLYKTEELQKLCVYANINYSFFLFNNTKGYED